MVEAVMRPALCTPGWLHGVKVYWEAQRLEFSLPHRARQIKRLKPVRLSYRNEEVGTVPLRLTFPNRAVVEAFVRIDDSEAPSDTPPALLALLTQPPDDDVAQKALQSIDKFLPPADVQALRILLWISDTHLGSLLLFGRFQPFTRMPLAARRAALLSLASSCLLKLRAAFKAFKAVSLFHFWNTAPARQLLGYPSSGQDPDRAKKPTRPDALKADASLARGIIDLGAAAARLTAPFKPRSEVATLAHDELRARGVRAFFISDASTSAHTAPVGSGGRLSDREARALRPHPPPDLVLECDAVVCGSGAGGGVAALALSRAGLRVLVLERATHVAHENMGAGGEAGGLETMYDRAGLLSSEDGAVSILAGSTVGGGTRINWSASWRTPDHVRREWAQAYGLSDFVSPAYDDALREVSERLGISDKVLTDQPPGHNIINAALLEGMHAAGLHAGPMPRNCSDADCSSWCCLGCPRGAKKDAAQTFLAEAVAEHGARVLTQASAERIVTAPREGGPEGRRKREALGVLAVVRPWPSTNEPSQNSAFQLFIRCKTVVSSCGSLHTPALLLRSGITCGGQVGRNLRLHPVTSVWATLPEARGLSAEGHAPPWAGPMMSTYSSDLNLFGRPSPAQPPSSSRPGDYEADYGAMVTTPVAHPGIYAAFLPFAGPLEHALVMSQLRSGVANIIVICRDRQASAGRVTLGPMGEPVVTYWPCREDQDMLLRGVEKAMICAEAAGATAIGTIFQDPRLWRRALPAPAEDGGAQRRAAIEAYIADLRAAGFRRNSSAILSAHQMGSCRMGSDPSNSAVDRDGQTHEVAGVYVADASVFPTSTGVNPMVTIEAICWMIMTRLGQQRAKKGA